MSKLDLSAVLLHTGDGRKFRAHNTVMLPDVQRFKSEVKRQTPRRDKGETSGTAISVTSLVGY